MSTMSELHRIFCEEQQIDEQMAAEYVYYARQAMEEGMPEPEGNDWVSSSPLLPQDCPF